jgi:hypothetical protein
MNPKRKATSFALIGSFMLLALPGAAAPQDQAPSSQIDPQSTACFSSHNYGSGAKTMKICISEHGNLVKFEAPAGFEQIGVLNTFKDGYAICTGAPPANTYYDTGGLEAGFGGSVIDQPKGPNTFPLTITRTTLDGIWRLKQTYKRDTKEKDLLIVMTLTNLSAANQPVVRLQRAFEGDVDNNTNTNAFFGRTHESVWEWVETLDADGRPQGHGLMLSNLSFANDPIDHTTVVNTVADYNPTGGGFRTGNGCIVFAGQTPTPAGSGANHVGRLLYGLSLGPGASATRTVVYRVF